MILGQLQTWKLVSPKMNWNVELSCLFAIAENYSQEQLYIHVCMIDTHVWITQLDSSHDRLSTALSACSQYLESGRENTQNCCYATKIIKRVSKMV